MKEGKISCRKYIVQGICGIVVAGLLLFGCGNTKKRPEVSVKYGEEIGIADGNVDLSKDTPDIEISDIKAVKGSQIDYLSKVVVANEDEYEDLQVFVDASTVDIFTPGDYTATYTFKYSGKSFSKSIVVTILESSDTASQEPTASGENGITDRSEGNNQENTTGGSEYKTQTTQGQTVQEQVADNSQDDNKNDNPVKNTGQNTASENNINTEHNNNVGSGSNNNNQTTLKRQMITSKENSTTTTRNIGNKKIELLSGKTVTIKNTTANYIVSTRTDVSTIEKNGGKYRVSKLIIRFNTGVEQILETMEERIK